MMSEMNYKNMIGEILKQFLKEKCNCVQLSPLLSVYLSSANCFMLPQSKSESSNGRDAENYNQTSSTLNECMKTLALYTFLAWLVIKCKVSDATLRIYEIQKYTAK